LDLVASLIWLFSLVKRLFRDSMCISS
jgi:hypothetical protein